MVRRRDARVAPPPRHGGGRRAASVGPWPRCVVVLALAAGTVVLLTRVRLLDHARPDRHPGVEPPPGSTPSRLGRTLDGLDRAIDR